MEIKSQDIYRIVFKEYPDILDVKQVGDLLGVSKKTVYNLIRDGSLPSIKVGREFRIPKFVVMKYLSILGSNEDEAILQNKCATPMDSI